jgi:hypothetical protein
MTIRDSPMVTNKHQGFAYIKPIHNHYTQDIQ